MGTVFASSAMVAHSPCLMTMQRPNRAPVALQQPVGPVRQLLPHKGVAARSRARGDALESVR